LIRDINQATSKPIWKLTDILVKIGNINISTDFIVMDIKEDSTVPILVGRGFLNNFGAIMTLREGLIRFYLPSGRVKFSMEKLKKRLKLKNIVSSSIYFLLKLFVILTSK
jgi:hypothetical protein